MRIEVSQLLYEPVGSRHDYQVVEEAPDLDDPQVVAPITGTFTLTRSDTGLELRGQVATTVRLECHRCLQPFDETLAVPVSCSYAEKPGEDELPITNGHIDLLPAIREELLLGLPIKQLCRQDCPGVAPAK